MKSQPISHPVYPGTYYYCLGKEKAFVVIAAVGILGSEIWVLSPEERSGGGDGRGGVSGGSRSRAASARRGREGSPGTAGRRRPARTRARGAPVRAAARSHTHTHAHTHGRTDGRTEGRARTDRQTHTRTPPGAPGCGHRVPARRRLLSPLSAGTAGSVGFFPIPPA